MARAREEAGSGGGWLGRGCGVGAGCPSIFLPHPPHSVGPSTPGPSPGMNLCPSSGSAAELRALPLYFGVTVPPHERLQALCVGTVRFTLCSPGPEMGPQRVAGECMRGGRPSKGGSLLQAQLRIQCFPEGGGGGEGLFLKPVQVRWFDPGSGNRLAPVRGSVTVGRKHSFAEPQFTPL